MTGMMEVNKKMKSLQPKETEGCLEYTNQLIKMLAGEKEAEELKVTLCRYIELLLEHRWRGRGEERIKQCSYTPDQLYRPKFIRWRNTQPAVLCEVSSGPRTPSNSWKTVAYPSKRWIWTARCCSEFIDGTFKTERPFISRNWCEGSPTDGWLINSKDYANIKKVAELSTWQKTQANWRTSMIVLISWKEVNVDWYSMLQLDFERALRGMIVAWRAVAAECWRACIGEQLIVDNWTVGWLVPSLLVIFQKDGGGWQKVYVVDVATEIGWYQHTVVREERTGQPTGMQNSCYHLPIELDRDSAIRRHLLPDQGYQRNCPLDNTERHKLS